MDFEQAMRYTKDCCSAVKRSESSIHPADRTSAFLMIHFGLDNILTATG